MRLVTHSWQHQAKLLCKTISQIVFAIGILAGDGHDVAAYDLLQRLRDYQTSTVECAAASRT